MKTFVCEKNFNAIITEKTCIARIKAYNKIIETNSDRYQSIHRGPIDNGRLCQECSIGQALIAKHNFTIE